MVAGIGIASPMPQTTMNTEQTYDSNQFQLGNNANPQEIRSNTANFNKFLGQRYQHCCEGNAGQREDQPMYL